MERTCYYFGLRKQNRSWFEHIKIKQNSDFFVWKLAKLKFDENEKKFFTTFSFEKKFKAGK